MHVLVTGASSGIGEAIAREYARGGAKLTLVARRRDRLEALATEVGGCCIVQADLTDPEEGLRALAEGEAAHGPIDVLVNNAGVQIVARTLDTDPAEGERLLALNVTTPLRLLIAVLKRMVERGTGTIVNISSLAALAPTPGMFYYNASKAALAAASESLARELVGTGVHVLTVYPGPVTTDMAEAALAKYEHAPRGLPTGTTKGLARLVVKAARKRKKRIVYPRVYTVARHFPATARWLIDRVAPVPAAVERGPASP